MSVKRPKRRKLSKRVPAALVRWIKKQNPAMKRAAAVRIRKLKGGGVSINPLLVRTNPRNGYVVYPSSTGKGTLSGANKLAKQESLRDGHARVENVDTQRTVATWRWGKKS